MNGSIGYPTFRWFMASTVTIGYLLIGILLIAPSTIIGIIAKDFNITVGEASLYAMGTYTLD
jgi:hypothetical protein